MTQTLHSEGNSFTVPAEAIERIALQFSAEGIEVHAAPTERITVEKRNRKGTPYTGDSQLIMDLENGVLSVRNTPVSFRPFMEPGTIVMYLPETYAGTLRIDVHAGAVHLENIQGDILDCTLRSGQFRLDNCTFHKQICVSGHSGSLILDKAEAPLLQLECFSGTIRCRQIQCTVFAAATHSGKQDVEVYASESCRLTARSGKLKFAGSAPLLETSTRSGLQELAAESVRKADMTAMSGTVRFSVTDASHPEEIILHLVSGRASLELPAAVTPVISMQSLTGTFQCQSESFASDGRRVQLTADVKTGSVRVVPC